MNCPRCGCEMTIDSHRKIPLEMCYKCGYIEGRILEDFDSKEENHGLTETNFMHLKKLGFNETVAFISENLGVDIGTVQSFLDNSFHV